MNPTHRARAQDSTSTSRRIQLVGAQATVVVQHLDPFRATYSGAHSLTERGATEPSLSLGAYIGARLTPRLELYLDAELLRGGAVGGGQGIAAIPNGDLVAPNPDTPLTAPFVARAFLRYVVPLDTARQKVDRAIDQLPGALPVSRVEVKMGKMAMTDDFDANRYGSNARVQFMNWALFSNTSWDYAGDVRGYALGANAAYVAPRWSLRAGSYLMPVDGASWGTELRDSRSDILQLSVMPGVHRTIMRLFVFQDVGRMSRYQDALAAAASSPPSLDAVARFGERKRGVGLNVEQPLSEHGNFGVLARAGWSNGHTDGFATAEVDRHMSIATQYRLRRVHLREQDIVGFGVARQWLSGEHREYLAAGGQGFFLGDGALTYAPETTAESYYRAQLGPHLQLGPDVQLVRNPGYNTARGPALLFAVRAHAEY